MKIFVIFFVFILVVRMTQAVPLQNPNFDIFSDQDEHNEIDEKVKDKERNERESATFLYGDGIPGHEAEIFEEKFNKDDIGNYNFSYKQSDLQQREETGEVNLDPNTGEYKLDNVIGSYEYIRPDGKKQRVEYVANKDGFHQGLETPLRERMGANFFIRSE